MVRLNIPYVQAVRGRDGRVRYYYRRKGFPRERLPDDLAALQRRVKELEDDCPTGHQPGSFAALVAHYKAAPEFRQLAEKTRTDYTRYLDSLAAEFGDLPVAGIPRAFVFALRDKYADRPRTANYYVQVFSRLMSFAVDRGYRANNPAEKIKKLETGPGHKPWGIREISRFRKAAAHLGWPQMGTALALALFTGQREGDVIAMTWAQYRGGAIEVVQQKTGERVWIPAHRILRMVLDRTPRTNAVTILTSKRGLPFKDDYFRHVVKRIADAAGIDGYTWHGLRKTATAALADAGCTEREIMEITGHKTHQMVSHYMQGSSKKRRARAAIRKLDKMVAYRGNPSQPGGDVV